VESQDLAKFYLIEIKRVILYKGSESEIKKMPKNEG
jgi:hypothetical protein